jgi:hypothetical protein
MEGRGFNSMLPDEPDGQRVLYQLVKSLCVTRQAMTMTLPSPSGEGGSRPALSPAGASRVRGFCRYFQYRARLQKKDTGTLMARLRVHRVRFHKPCHLSALLGCS